MITYNQKSLITRNLLLGFVCWMLDVVWLCAYINKTV